MFNIVFGQQAPPDGRDAAPLRPTQPSPLTPNALPPSVVFDTFSCSELRQLQATCGYWRDAIMGRPVPTLTSTQHRWASRDGDPDPLLARQALQDNAHLRARIRVAPESSWESLLLEDEGEVRGRMTDQKRLVCTWAHRGTFVYEESRTSLGRWTQVCPELLTKVTFSDDTRYAFGVRGRYVCLWERNPARTGWRETLKNCFRTPDGYVLRAQTRVQELLRNPRLWIIGQSESGRPLCAMKVGRKIYAYDGYLRATDVATLPERLPLSVAYHEASRSFKAVWRDGEFASYSLGQAGVPIWRTTTLSATMQDARISNVGNRMVTIERDALGKSRIVVHDICTDVPTLLFAHVCDDTVGVVSADTDGDNFALRRTCVDAQNGAREMFVHLDVEAQRVRGLNLGGMQLLNVLWADTKPAIGALYLRRAGRTNVRLFRVSDAKETPLVVSVVSPEDTDLDDGFSPLGFDASGTRLYQYGENYRDMDVQTGPTGPRQLRMFKLV